MLRDFFDILTQGDGYTVSLSFDKKFFQRGGTFLPDAPSNGCP